MKETHGPSINLDNINFINHVEKYEKKYLKKTKSEGLPKTKKEIMALGKKDFINKDYFDEYGYMMKENILEMFKKGKIPYNDRKILETAFNNEIKELKQNLEELKEMRQKLLVDSNKIYLDIEKVNDEMIVICMNIIDNIKR